jgi:signal transduction histidine kinase/ActR/RegA family two-component response regulator
VKGVQELNSSKIVLDNLDHLDGWGVIATDVDLRVIGWNRWLEQRTGKSASDVSGRNLLELYPELIVRSMDRYYRQALEGQACILSQRFHKYLIPMPPTVPATRLMNMQQTARLTPLTENDIVCGTLTLIEDVTERIVTEEELRKQADRLEEANRHKDEFLAMLAHELRNPLGPIRNGIRILDIVEAGSPEARQTREMMDRQVTHMSRLVDDLLDVSRIAQGKVRLRHEPCDLNAIVQEVVEDYRPLIEKSGIQLILESAAHPCGVNGDRIRLAQIIGNVLHNANKFTNAGGEVRVTCESDRQSNTVTVRVSDTGIGMSRDTLSRVFDTFTQADISLDRSKGGLGLGLSLAKGLTNLHRGSIEAASPGLEKGSTFTLKFPLVGEELHAGSKSDRPEETMPETRRILIIEDHRDMARSMQMLLTHMGYEVEWAESGTAGLELVGQFRPNIVLCDIGLPGKDGYEVARALRNDPATKSAYLIAQSGYGQDEDLRKSHDAGFDLHLTKPVDFTELKKILAAVPTGFN